MTVAGVYVRGEYPYTPEYVARLLGMVRRHLSRPFQFVCLTDQPEAMPAGVEPIVIDKLAGFAPWSKLHLFNPAHGFTGRMLYLDLDSLIVAPLDPLIDTPGEFLITADPPHLMANKKRTDAYGRSIVRRFNSSVMVWDAGSQDDFFADWTPEVAHRLSGDQDWIGETRPWASTWPRAWFPRISELDGLPPNHTAKVVLCKVPKNHVAAERWPWVREVWQ